MCFILLCLILSRCVCIICLNMIPMRAFLVWFMTRSEKTMATHSSSLAWKIPGAEEPGGLPSMGSQCRTQLKRLSNSSRSSMTCCYCSVAKSCLTPCDPMDCNVPGFSILHCLPEFAQIYVHWADDAIQPAHPPLPPSLLLPSIFPSIRIFSNDSGHFLSQLFTLGGQSIGASTSVLPVNKKGWFPLLTNLVSLLSKGLSRVFCNTTVQRHQFFSAQLSLRFNSYNSQF